MKGKLLKKIKKRFSWYKSKTGKFILIDKKTKSVNIIDNDFIFEHLNVATVKRKKEIIDDLEIDIKEWQFRWLKTMMLKPFGYTFSNIHYNRSLKSYNSRLKKWKTTKD